MAFIAGAMIGSSIIGGYVQSEAAKSAAKAGQRASDKESYIWDQATKRARLDQGPQREAGYTALDAMMSMTGLGGGYGSTGSYKGYADASSSPGANAAQEAPWGSMSPKQYLNTLSKGQRRSLYSKKQRQALRSNNWSRINKHLPEYADQSMQYPGLGYGLAMGGPAAAGQTYNINEIGPENYYSGGAITRNSQPQTIRPSTQGYVRPYGAAIGRAMGGQVGPQDQVPPTSGGYTYQDYFNNGGGYIPQLGEDLGGGRTAETGGPLPPSYSDNGGPQAQLPSGGQPMPNSTVQENPGGMGGRYNFMTDPGYQFRQDEGMRALSRNQAPMSGAASGGFARRAIRYGQDYASQEYQNVYNRIAAIAGMGGQAAGQSGQNALYGGQGQAGAANMSGYYGAGAAIGQGNAWGTAFNQIAQGAGGNWGKSPEADRKKWSFEGG